MYLTFEGVVKKKKGKLVVRQEMLLNEPGY